MIEDNLVLILLMKDNKFLLDNHLVKKKPKDSRYHFCKVLD